MRKLVFPSTSVVAESLLTLYAVAIKAVGHYITYQPPLLNKIQINFSF